MKEQERRSRVQPRRMEPLYHESLGYITPPDTAREDARIYEEERQRHLQCSSMFR